MVTFTRMATGELRERVRERLVSAEQGLERALAGAPPHDDAVVAAARHRHARRGPASAASGSPRRSPTSTPRPSPPPTASARRCSAASASLGDVEPDTTFVEDVTDLCDEVVDDLYVRRFAPRAARPQFARAEALDDRPRGDRQPGARRSSRRDAPDDQHRRDAACASPRPRARSSRRASAALGVMTYDDLLTRLSDTLDGRERRRRRRAAARPLPRRARRRVPGHRPDPVGDHAHARSATATVDARAHRRPEAGDLRVPRRRRLRLPRRRPQRPARRPR